MEMHMYTMYFEENKHCMQYMPMRSNCIFIHSSEQGQAMSLFDGDITVTVLGK